MDVGAHLRSARERRGQTIEQVARATKLSLPVIRLIERGDWEHLPGGLLTRGHLRAYAAEVGLDPERVVAEYLSQLPPEPVEPPPRPAVSVADAPPRKGRAMLTVVVATAAMIGMCRWTSDTPRQPMSPSRATMESPADSISPAARAEEVPDAVPSAVQAGETSRLSLAVDATGPCWVSVRADGRVAVFRLLQTGETLTVDANEELLLRVGAPESFRYSLNGLSGRPLGPSGQPVTVRINESNLQSFTAADLPTADDRD